MFHNSHNLSKYNKNCYRTMLSRTPYKYNITSSPWPLRNSHFLKTTVNIFLFMPIFLFPLTPTRLVPDLTVWVSILRRNSCCSFYILMLLWVRVFYLTCINKAWLSLSCWIVCLENIKVNWHIDSIVLIRQHLHDILEIPNRQLFIFSVECWNDHGCVPFVIYTNLSFPHSRLGLYQE